MRRILKGAIVLLIAIAMVFSTVAIADTQTKETPELNIIGQGSATGARGQVVWDNDMEYSGLAAAQKDDEYPFYAECADDFHFEQTTEVCDVHWVGGYWQTGYGSAHWPWEITFYYDDGSGERPGAVFIGPLVFDNTQYTETLISDTGTSIYYEISVDLPENYVFPPCEKFWISIRGVGIFPPQSGWGYHPGIQLHSMIWKCELLGYPDWTDSYDIWGEDRDMCFQLTTKDEPVPPSAPEIDGPPEGDAGVPVTFTFHSSDENGDMVRYHIDWGDGTSETTDWAPPCTPVTVTHTYAEKGTYTITAYAEDETGLVGPSASFTIVIPRAKAINNPVIQQILGRLFNAFPILKYLLGF